MFPAVVRYRYFCSASVLVISTLISRADARQQTSVRLAKVTDGFVTIGTDSVSMMRPGPKRLGTLWVYGDSIGLRFLESIKKRALCKSIFQNCKGTYNWIYEVRENQSSGGKKMRSY